MKINLLYGILLLPLVCQAQVGINTATPQKTLHVNGSLQLVKELSVGGTASTEGSAGNLGQVLKSKGPGVAPSWQNLVGVPTSTGTVIAVDGVFLVAQEITTQMTADFKLLSTGIAVSTAIGNLNKEIIDNENRYNSSATTNSFTVSTDGVYMITMILQLSTSNGTSPVIGVWDNTSNKWVARVNDLYRSAPPPGVIDQTAQTYKLITSVPMLAAKTYSFRIANTADLTLRNLSWGTTGSGPVTQVSVKRLK